ncbi:MAG: ATP-grasp domain-containing protein [Anaerolineae bacterium]|nr:ATP-grasp domain-containing protein [Anaerolineae bacterium]
MKVLVANRGEIAVRILRACRELSLPSIAVYSDGDRDALHTRYADEAMPLGPTAAAESYLNIAAVLAAAQRSGAQAVHPGYGFLSENPTFAEAVEAAGMIFVGPRPETLRVTGDKVAARRVAREAGLQVLRGPDQPYSADSVDSGCQSRSEPDGLALDLGYPLLVKAVSGGGGRGIRLVRQPDELGAMVAAARREALASFGDDSVYLEPLVVNARHIEVQIMGDGQGNVLQLGERECSIQRRRQKLIEESPAPGLDDDQRTALVQAAMRLGRMLRYRSLGTVEFLLDAHGVFHFIELNPRIQVEHPVTEMVTGIDLVKEQLRLASGSPLSYDQAQIRVHGAAIEARVLAESDFLPTTGEITYLKEPGGPGVRVDSALYQGMHVTTDYDSLLAKVIAWGESRGAALERLRRALQEFQIGGVVTDVVFLQQILESAPFVNGHLSTTFLDGFQPPLPLRIGAQDPEIAAAAAYLTHIKRHTPGRSATKATGNPWQMAAWREQMVN